MNTPAATSHVDGATSRSNGARPTVEPPVLGTPEHTDYYLLDELLTDDQRALRARVGAFMAGVVSDSRLWLPRHE
jgi:hypothetical protein